MGKRRNNKEKKQPNRREEEDTAAMVGENIPAPSPPELEISASTSAATPNSAAVQIPVGVKRDCGHTQAKALKYIPDIMGPTLKIEPDQEDPRKYRLKFTYYAYVAGSISLYIFQVGGEENDTAPTTKVMHSFTKDVEPPRSQQKFIYEIDRDDFPLHKVGLTEVYHLEIKSKARVTPIKDGSEIRVSQTTQAVFEYANGKIQVRFTNQIVWVNGKIYRCHDFSGICKAMGIDKNDPDRGCLLCLANDNPGILHPVGKISLTNKVIGKGSNGRTVVYEGSYDGMPVAVKRISKGEHHVAADEEIQILKKSGHHSNIVRFYGTEDIDRFVFIALERCKCSLHDLISSWDRNSNEYELTQDGFTGLKLWKPNEYQPLEPLLKLMRDTVRGLAYLHKHEIIHGNLKPQNVLIYKDTSEDTFSAKVFNFSRSTTVANLDTGTSGWQAPELLRNEEPTLAADLFSLGILLFYCITGGTHPFGDHENVHDENIKKNNKTNLSILDDVPEARDLISRLLHPNPKSRPIAAEVYNYPLFWDSWTYLSFLRDASDRVELEDRSSDLVKSLKSVAQKVFSGCWDTSLDTKLLADNGQYRKYHNNSLRDLLRLIRNKLNHYRQLDKELQNVLGEVPTGYQGYFRRHFPKLVMEVYKVLKEPCGEEVFLQRYYKQADVELGF